MPITAITPAFMSSLSGGDGVREAILAEPLIHGRICVDSPAIVDKPSNDIAVGLKPAPKRNKEGMREPALLGQIVGHLAEVAELGAEAFSHRPTVGAVEDEACPLVDPVGG